ncbi:MAG TPA: hypothetical protein VN667_11275 [Burkholderiales bacterium]|nr:hypothetical protein [Burkholderiales bacterium]
MLLPDGRHDGRPLALQVVQHVVRGHKLRPLRSHAAVHEFVDTVQQLVHHALGHFLGDAAALGQAH